MGMDLRAIPDPTRTRRPAVQLYHPPSQPPSRPDTSIGFARVTVGGGEDRHATPAPSVGRTASAWPRGGRMAPQVDRFCQLCQLGYITWVGGSRSLLEKQAILAYKLTLGLALALAGQAAAFRNCQVAAPLKRAGAWRPTGELAVLPQLSSCGPIEAQARLSGPLHVHSFRNCQVAAPLKPTNKICKPPAGHSFRNCQVAAPLKRKGRRLHRARPRHPSATVKLRPH